MGLCQDSKYSAPVKKKVPKLFNWGHFKIIALTQTAIPHICGIITVYIHVWELRVNLHACAGKGHN